MMDRMTGKTLSDCFVEFKTDNDLKQAIEMGNQKHIKGRIVSVFRYKYEDMMKWIFPKWSGHFMENTAVPTKQNHHNNPFITKEEMNSLLVICKNYKVRFTTNFFFLALHLLKYSGFSFIFQESVQKDLLKILLVLLRNILGINLN